LFLRDVKITFCDVDHVFFIKSVILEVLKLGVVVSVGGEEILKIYILEDNYIHRKYITLKLSQIDKAAKFDIIALENEEIFTFYDKLDLLSVKKDDVFLIDINLNFSRTGIDIAEKIRSVNKDCFIIFISSEMGHGIQIINRTILPIAYLSKQFQEGNALEKQLETILNKIERYINKDLLTGEKLMISMKGEVEYIDLSDVNYIETIKGNRYAANIHYTDLTEFVNKSFSYFRKNIENDSFYMELKSYIINVANIKSIEKKEYSILFENLEFLYLGRKGLKKLLAFMEKGKV
jgi:two-component system response regulator AgrA